MNIFEIFAVALLAVGLIAGIIWYYRKSKKEVIALGVVFWVRCENCGTQYDVSTEEFLKRSTQKSKSVTKSKIVAGAVVNEPQYTYIAKRFHCPNCRQMHWAEILNFNEYQAKARGIVLTNALLVFGVLFVMAQVIMLIGSIALKIASLF